MIHIKLEGPQGSGKTTLLNTIIPMLEARGYIIKTIHRKEHIIQVEERPPFPKK